MTLSPYRLMSDEVLVDAIRDLERLTSQPRIEYLPAAEREAYLGQLVRARAEAERRCA